MTSEERAAVADEREACLKIAERLQETSSEYCCHTTYIANTIRARSSNKPA